MVVCVTGYDGHRSVQPGGMDHTHYSYSALPDRRPFEWPGGARVALIVLICVEAALPQLPAEAWTPPDMPKWLDVSAWSLHEYGRRVGVYRLAEILDALSVRATMPVSDLALDSAPTLVEFARQREWEFVAHGRAANLLVTSAMTAEQEVAYLRESRDAIWAATGHRPSGWAGPAMSESVRTPALAADAGYEYLLDWGNDDQPYFLRNGSLVSLPVSVDTSDHLVLAAGSAQTPWDFGEALRDHLDDLCLAASGGRVLTLSLRAHLSGQPFRARYVREFLTYARSRPEVWFATGRGVVEAFRAASSEGP